MRRNIEKLKHGMKAYSKNEPAWLFFFSTAMFYISLGIVSPLIVEHPVLFVSMQVVYPIIPVLWGMVGLASLAVAVVGIYKRNRVLIKVFSTVQVMLWVYASVAYMIGGVFMLFLAVALPHLLFWSWNYLVRDD